MLMVTVPTGSRIVMIMTLVLPRESLRFWMEWTMTVMRRAMRISSG